MENIFDRAVADKLISRINSLTPNTAGQWGKMNVAQMLAHCNVTYEMVYTDRHRKPNGFLKLILKEYPCHSFGILGEKCKVLSFTRIPPKPSTILIQVPAIEVM